MKQVLIAFDQLLNAVFGGYADETISARCWRLRERQPYSTLRAIVDGLFFWEPEHCKQSYESEVERMQSPIEERH